MAKFKPAHIFTQVSHRSRNQKNTSKNPKPASIALEWYGYPYTPIRKKWGGVWGGSPPPGTLAPQGKFFWGEVYFPIKNDHFWKTPRVSGAKFSPSSPVTANPTATPRRHLAAATSRAHFSQFFAQFFVIFRRVSRPLLGVLTFRSLLLLLFSVFYFHFHVPPRPSKSHTPPQRDHTDAKFRRHEPTNQPTQQTQPK